MAPPAREGALRRSERVVLITKMLLESPGRVISLKDLAERFGVAKSTVSEDLAQIRELIEREPVGELESLVGAAGGVRYFPRVRAAAIRETVHELCRALASPERILPGGFLYMSDLIASPQLTHRVGEIFATCLAREQRPDAVVTLETRGIPIAMMTARALDVPLVIVRRASRVTDGTVVSMNYVSGSKRIETMSLSRRALPTGARVVVIDDFMKAGGSARGLIDLMKEFEAEVQGIGVLVVTAEPRVKLVDDYVALAVLEAVDERAQEVRVRPSRWVEAQSEPSRR